MLLNKMEEELKELIGNKKTVKVMSFVKEEALKTDALIDTYYKVLPNRKIYFFKRFIDTSGKLTVERMNDGNDYEILAEHSLTELSS